MAGLRLAQSKFGRTLEEVFFELTGDAVHASDVPPTLPTLSDEEVAS